MYDCHYVSQKPASEQYRRHAPGKAGSQPAGFMQAFLPGAGLHGTARGTAVAQGRIHVIGMWKNDGMNGSMMVTAEMLLVNMLGAATALVVEG